MKTFTDAPDDIHPADKIGWVQGYNQCLADHEYMDTNARLQAKLSVSADRIDELEKELAEALRRIPARHAETKVKQAEQIAPANPTLDYAKPPHPNSRKRLRLFCWFWFLQKSR